MLTKYLEFLEVINVDGKVAEMLLSLKKNKHRVFMEKQRLSPESRELRIKQYEDQHEKNQQAVAELRMKKYSVDQDEALKERVKETGRLSQADFEGFSIFQES